MWSLEVPDENQFGLQLPKQDFYSFKLCTVDEVHAVRTFTTPLPGDAHGFLK